MMILSLGDLVSVSLGFPLYFTVGNSNELAMYLPWQMTFYLVTGITAGIIVSLFTKPVPKEKLDRFYELVRTPVAPGEPAPPEPCVIPEGVDVPLKRAVFKNSSLELLMPRKSSVIGFVVCWCVVGLMITTFILMTR